MFVMDSPLPFHAIWTASQTAIKSTSRDDKGIVRPEFFWAALDCPSGFATGIGPKRIAMLGKLALEIVAPVEVDQRCVITSWPLGSEGRKLYGASALFSEHGALQAYAKATWVLLQ